MAEDVNKPFSLEKRAFLFAKNVCLYCRGLEKNISNIIYIKQVIRSSSSIGANYIEANESLGKKDFIMKVRISRKEAKETIFWLRLIKETNEALNPKINDLIIESNELRKILSAIIDKSKLSLKE